MVFADLVNWVNTSVARVGSAYTGEAIDACVGEGSLSAPMADQLRQLARVGQADDSADDVEPDEAAAVVTELRAILSRQVRS